MAAYPSLLLAYIEQHREYALLGRGTGIKVICKDLVQILAAVMHNDLLAVEMGMAEGGRNIYYRAGNVIIVYLFYGYKALHVGQRKGEEGGVGRADHKALIAVFIIARAEGQHYQSLLGQPIEGLLAEA